MSSSSNDAVFGDGCTPLGDVVVEVEGLDVEEDEEAEEVDDMPRKSKSSPALLRPDELPPERGALGDLGGLEGAMPKPRISSSLDAGAGFPCTCVKRVYKTRQRSKSDDNEINQNHNYST